jgi:hypothetical protein
MKWALVTGKTAQVFSYAARDQAADFWEGEPYCPGPAPGQRSHRSEAKARLSQRGPRNPSACCCLSGVPYYAARRGGQRVVIETMSDRTLYTLVAIGFAVAVAALCVTTSLMHFR